ncbi:MAG: Gfo/Idh/MocA family oxidoreductase [Phycisphaerales bacterium]|nr:Gfo/Idh/MocA family oxidoreductase [Phycisphaerales bacterium]
MTKAWFPAPEEGFRATRRDAIRLGAAGVLGLAGLGAPARARIARTSPNDRVTLGFIGMGIQNRYHLDAFLHRDDVRVLAVCDVDTKRREHCKHAADARYGAADCGAYNDYRELLARRDIDAVVIGTPDHWHALQVVDACRAGKDVYCEKPLSFTLREGKAMIDAVRANDRVLQTGSQQRTEYGGKFRHAVELVRSGRIGEIVCVNVGIHAMEGSPTSRPCDLPAEDLEPGLDWDRWLGPAPMRPYHSILSPRGVHNHYPNWRLFREYSGGMITDWGAHMFDIAQWGLGMDESGPVEVHPPARPGFEWGARLVYPTGVEVTHAGPTGVTFMGTGGWIYVSREDLRASRDDIVNEPLPPEATLHEETDHRENWLKCLASRRRPVCDVEIGARTAAVCHLVNLAYWHRTSLHWDPVKWAFAGGADPAWFDAERRPGYELRL